MWSFAKIRFSLYLPGYRTFEFTERAEVIKYYPQYYHKIDKVNKNKTIMKRFTSLSFPYIFLFHSRMVARSTLSNLASWTSKRSMPSRRKSVSFID